jgi:natural product precursor
MKTLGKLKINNEKIITKKELKSLGGGETHCCWCSSGAMIATNPTDCAIYCGELGDGNQGWYWTC